VKRGPLLTGQLPQGPSGVHWGGNHGVECPVSSSLLPPHTTAASHLLLRPVRTTAGAACPYSRHAAHWPSTPCCTHVLHLPHHPTRFSEFIQARKGGCKSVYFPYLVLIKGDYIKIYIFRYIIHQFNSNHRLNRSGEINQHAMLESQY
jgi:hypothetical protein